MNEQGPNFFHVAANPLAEDGLFAWLLTWADAGYKKLNPALHAVAFELLRALFTRGGAEPPARATTVTVRRDVDDVDLLVEVGKEWMLAIQDRFRIEKHAARLRRVWAAVAKKHGSRAHRAFVYLRTDEQSELDLIDACGWRPFGRRDLVELLRPSRGLHGILEEFVDHLERLEAEIQSFRTLKDPEWTQLAWAGLFQELQPLLGGRWGWVVDPRAGFMAFTYGTQQVEGGSLFIRLEEEQLAVRVEIKHHSDQKPVRDRWLAQVLAYKGAMHFVRPSKVGFGQWVTLGLAEGGYLRYDAEGKLDLPATIEVLRSVAEIVHGLVTNPIDLTAPPPEPPVEELAPEVPVKRKRGRPPKSAAARAAAASRPAR